ncbi:MAG: hypothetical protein ACRDL6_07480 [Solirubrobacterales bacterium]
MKIAAGIAALLALTLGVADAGAHKKKTDRQTTVTFQDVPGPGNDVVSGQVSLGRAPDPDEFLQVGGEPLAQAAGKKANCLARARVLVKHTLTSEGGGADDPKLVATAFTGPTGAWQATYEASGASLLKFDTFQIEVAKKRLKPKNAKHKHVCKGAFGDRTVFSS